MKTQNTLSFEYSYLNLPEKFYSFEYPQVFKYPEFVKINDKLCRNIGIDPENLVKLIDEIKSGRYNKKFFSQAYSGHQFGHFTNLGDGRALILGEHIIENGDRFDIQLKGSGRTVYARNGDGKATLKAMLREYLISEAMYNLGIPTSRSLAVLKTGEKVYREQENEGAAIFRLMKSHIRIGTFEYAANFCTKNDLKELAYYTIKRLYPELINEDNPIQSLLNKIIKIQVNLVSDWMRVGFIHGVMNTDNVALSGETFDYGPCAFMNYYNPATVYSSIDHFGRYAYGNQPRIIKWNLARFAETLLPILHDDENMAIQMAQNEINEFDKLWETEYYKKMLNKIGFETASPGLYFLIDDILKLMQKNYLDFTNTFFMLSNQEGREIISNKNDELKQWVKTWEKFIDDRGGFENSIPIMQKNNPIVIPRNHIVERALDEAIAGNTYLFENLLKKISNPYSYDIETDEYMNPPDFAFETSYQTFCGT
ncbi:MAG: YdiU family protein [Bacteroidales bacterium]|jgi:uncharacterized protein YdiU (UPF0061 family)|nr:YdiU family protein [Bacteroidales bacterium]HOM36134.1 YdiU family protein [Bacteroidales bacterium]HPD23450.1 YdiU family protein [Bacteroidales bacterium]HRS99582.1 YdiU family protein [Bacteroidales bacterium]HRT79664.1 YdiU family protein [Bacteroidales bacterium]